MWIDGHDGERYDVEEIEVEHLLAIRPDTVAAVVEGEIPGRGYWEQQLAEIDDELENGRGVYPEAGLNYLWRRYVTDLLDALKREWSDQARAARIAGEPVPRWKGLPVAM